MNLLSTLKKGLQTGLKTTWILAKVIFPITMIIKLLSYTPILPGIIHYLTPWMKWLGLPGEAAIPLVLGVFLNLYAAVGAILSLSLSVKSVFIIVLMLSFAHNMIVETSVTTKLGVKPWVMVPFRIGLALVSAILISAFWDGGNNQAQFAFIPTVQQQVNGWDQIMVESLKSAILGIAQTALIVIPIMILIQILKDRNGLTLITQKLSIFTRFLGMKENASLTLVAGLVFGLAYGAGVMLQAYREDGLSKKDMYQAVIFLGTSHAVIEDTLIFVPLGIAVWPLLLIRMLTAIVFTWILGFFWNNVEIGKGKTQIT